GAGRDHARLVAWHEAPLEVLAELANGRVVGAVAEDGAEQQVRDELALAALEDDQRVLTGRVVVEDATGTAAAGPEAGRAALGVREVAVAIREDELARGIALERAHHLHGHGDGMERPSPARLLADLRTLDPALGDDVGAVDV